MLTLLISGIDRTSWLKVDSCKIRRQLNGRCTADLQLEDIGRGYRPALGASVVVSDDGVKRFAGQIESIAEQRYPGTEALMYSVGCSDFNAILDRRLVTWTYDAGIWTLKQVIEHIVTTFLSGEGITTVHVETGPVIGDTFTFSYEPAANAIGKVCTAAGYSSSIDFDRDLHVSQFASTPAPFEITEQTDWRNLTVRRDLQQYRNRQHERTDRGITETRTDTFTGDGVKRLFSFTKPAQSLISVKRAGAQQTFGPDPFGSFDWWFLAAADPTSIQNLAPKPVLGAGETLVVQYVTQPENIVTVQDDGEIAARAAAEGGTGIYEAVREERSITSLATLASLAQGELEANGKVPTTITVETDEQGAEPGQRVHIDIPDHQLLGNFLIETVDQEWVALPDSDAEFLRTTITATDRTVAIAPPRWQSYFTRLEEVARGGAPGSVTDADTGSTPDASSFQAGHLVDGTYVAEMYWDPELTGELCLDLQIVAPAAWASGGYQVYRRYTASDGSILYDAVQEASFRKANADGQDASGSWIITATLHVASVDIPATPATWRWFCVPVDDIGSPKKDAAGNPSGLAVDLVTLDPATSNRVTPTPPEQIADADWSIAVTGTSVSAAGVQIQLIRATITSHPANAETFDVWIYKGAAPPADPHDWQRVNGSKFAAAGGSTLDFSLERPFSGSGDTYQAIVKASSATYAVTPDGTETAKSFTITPVGTPQQITSFSVAVTKGNENGRPSGIFVFSFGKPQSGGVVDREFAYCAIDRVECDSSFNLLSGAQWGSFSQPVDPGPAGGWWDLPRAPRYYKFRAYSVSKSGKNALATAITANIAVTAAENTGNIHPNPGFEQDFYGYTLVAPIGGPSPNPCTISTAIVHGGSKSCRHGAGVGSVIYTDPYLSAKAGKAYQISFWVRTDAGTDGGDAALYLLAFDKDGAQLGATSYVSGTVTKPGTSWTPITYRSVPLPANTATVRLQINFPDHTAGAWYLDDIAVEERESLGIGITVDANGFLTPKTGTGLGLDATSIIIPAGAVTNSLLAALAVATANLQDDSVASTKIASAAITTAKIGTGQITALVCANGFITNALLGNAVVGTANIMNLAVATANIQDLAVTNAKINDLSVNKLSAGTANFTGDVVFQRAGGSASITISSTSIALVNASISLSSLTNAGSSDQAKVNSGAITVENIARAAELYTQITGGTVTAVRRSTAGPADGYDIDINATTMGAITIKKYHWNGAVWSFSTSGSISLSGASWGASGSFTTADSKTVTVAGGFITAIS